MKRIIFLLVFIFLVSVCAFADRYTAPKVRQIYSENKAFLMNLNVLYNRIEVFASADAKVLLWTLNKKIGFHRYFISNDGKRIFIVKNRFCHRNELNVEAVSVYTKKGLEKSFSYKQLSIPRKCRRSDNAPAGDQWRVWRNDDVEIKKNQIVISVVGKAKQKIDMLSGDTYLITEGTL